MKQLISCYVLNQQQFPHQCLLVLLFDVNKKKEMQVSIMRDQKVLYSEVKTFHWREIYWCYKAVETVCLLGFDYVETIRSY